MARTLTEKQVLNKLKIKDFRHMTKDKIVSFTSMLDRMDPEVAKKALEQFPHFKDMATGVVHGLKETSDSVMKHNANSNEIYMNICSSIIVSLEEELKRETLSFDEKEWIIDRIIEVSKDVKEKDSENKQFLSNIWKSVAVVGSVALVVGAALLGVNINNKNGGSTV